LKYRRLGALGVRKGGKVVFARPTSTTIIIIIKRKKKKNKKTKAAYNKYYSLPLSHLSVSLNPLPEIGFPLALVE